MLVEVNRNIGLNKELVTPSNIMNKREKKKKMEGACFISLSGKQKENE